VHVHRAAEEARPQTGQVKEENPQFLRQGMLRSSRSSPPSPWSSRRPKDFPSWAGSPSATWERPSRQACASMSRRGHDLNPSFFTFEAKTWHNARGYIERDDPKKVRQRLRSDQGNIAAHRRRHPSPIPCPPAPQGAGAQSPDGEGSETWDRWR